MSLTSAMFTGVSGLLNNGEALNVIGNNIANVNTVGYKDARSVFSDMLSANIGNNSQVGSGVQMQAVQNMYTQGTTQSTGNVTDLAIQGNSLFAMAAPGTAGVQTPTSSFLTRAGSFTVDATNTLVNPNGYQVLGTDGKPISFANTGAAPTTDFSKITAIAPNGTITYLATDGITQNYYNGNGVAPLPVSGGVPPTVGLAVISAADPGALTKMGSSLFQANAAAGIGSFVAPNGTSEQVLSNSLESSNVDMSTEFVNMITTQRAYSANSKTITTADQMTQEVLGLIR